MRGRPQQSVIDPTQRPAKRALRPKPIQQLMERAPSRQGEKETKQPDPENSEQVMIYSSLEVLRQKNFEEFTREELREARRLMAALDWQLGERQTRRKRPARHGAQIDFTRVLRRNLKYGAELVQLPERERRSKPRPLVVLADVSGSMERYTRMVLHLLHALSHEVARVEVFTFGTRLTRITPDLKRRDVDASLARVAQHVPDWSGGTRIGETLKTFNFKWARRVLRAGAVVLVISDGWDRGDLSLLQREMARLQRSCFRLIWLNPLLGAPSFEPRAQGLQVALPYVDDLLPVHNLASLEMLVAKLSTLRDTRPLRRQQPHAVIPSAETPVQLEFMDQPQMGTSDYVRRTLRLEMRDGLPSLRYGETADDA